MTIQEIATIAQSGAIVVAFLFVTFKAPAMYDNWLKHQTAIAEMAASENQKQRDVQAEILEAANIEAATVRAEQAQEREADRVQRHDQANKFSAVVSEMFASFRAEMAAERLQCANDHEKIMTLQAANTEQILSAIHVLVLRLPLPKRRLETPRESQ